MTNKPPFSEMYDLLPKDLGFSLSKTFDQISIVEQEIACAMETYPNRKVYIYNSFMLFQNEAYKFTNYDLQLWRSHVRELLTRVGNPPSRKENREMGTWAEAMIAFSEASLAAPLTEDGTMAFATIFEHIYGKEKMQKLFQQVDMTKYESFKGAIDQLIDFARKGTSCVRAYPTEEYITACANRDLLAGNDVPVPEVFQMSLGV